MSNVRRLHTPPLYDDAKQNVIDAAIKCFKQYGPQRTSMADIAEEAGVSRKTLYRIFEDRPNLVEATLVQLTLSLKDKVISKVGKYRSVRDAIIEGSVLSVEIALDDDLVNEIIQKDTNYRIEQLHVRGNDTILEHMFDFWGPIFDRGKREGLIRKNLSNERLMDLFLSSQATLLMRDDFSKKQKRQFIRDLLWAAITNKKIPDE